MYSKIKVVILRILSLTLILCNAASVESQNNRMQPSGIYQRDSNMKILFGSYSQIFPALGVSSDILKVVREGQQQYYALAVEMIARGYVNAGATMPTVNAFFLRRALHENLPDVYQEMLALNIRSLLKALGNNKPEKIAICLGPMNDCYIAKEAPETKEAYLFHKHQYELCLEVLREFKLSVDEIVFLHETIGTGREAIGLSQAAQSLGLPLIISFVVDQNGHLLSGESVEMVIRQIDTQTAKAVLGFSLNCCAPTAFERVVATFQDKSMIKRLIGFYPSSFDENHLIYDSGEYLFEPPKYDSLKAIIDVGRTYHLTFIGTCCGFYHDDLQLLIKMTQKNL